MCCGSLHDRIIVGVHVFFCDWKSKMTAIVEQDWVAQTLINLSLNQTLGVN
jgi:hypothetical protein